MDETLDEIEEERMSSRFLDEHYSYYVQKTPWRPGKLNGYVIMQELRTSKEGAKPWELREPENIPMTLLDAFILLLNFAKKYGWKGVDEYNAEELEKRRIKQNGLV